MFATESAIENGRSVLVVIGIDDYRHWQKLRNPVSDAEGVHHVLMEKFGFVNPIPPLLNQAATKSAILNLVEDQLRKELNENDRLVLFFAGHGHTRVDKIGGKDIDTGFLVPVEAKTGAEEQWSDYIKLDDFLQTISTLPARQVLVILDSCHSGFAVGGSLKNFRGETNRFEADLAQRVSRRVITSAMRDQLARDDGPLPDHSLFAGLLVNGLNWGRSDLDGNGLVTSSELGLYLQQVVGTATGSNQTPDFGAFDLDDRGELIISLKHQTFDALKARAFNALYRGQLEDLRHLTKEASNFRPKSPQAHYLNYRQLMDRKIPEAFKSIQDLLDLKPPPGVIPLSSFDLGTLQYQLRYWEPALSIPDGEASITIEFLSGDSKESLEVIQVKEYEGGVFMHPIKAGEIIQLKIGNTSESPLDAYMIEIDTDGRVTPIRLWEDLDRLLSGIPPHTVVESLPFRDGGERGVSEWRLFTSSIRLNMLAAPPSRGARGSSLPFVSPEGVRVKTIRYLPTQ